MRKLFLIIAGLMMSGMIATSASALPGASRAPAQVTESAVIQVHSGPHACHWVGGRWWRDTRPYSTPCYGHWPRWHRRCHCHWHHHHHHRHWHY